MLHLTSNINGVGVKSISIGVVEVLGSRKRLDEVVSIATIVLSALDL
jgi:hypothetical protein